MAKSFGEVEGAMDVRCLFHKDLHVSPACKLESSRGDRDLVYSTQMAYTYPANSYPL
jgi:hypothetical protein